MSDSRQKFETGERKKKIVSDWENLAPEIRDKRKEKEKRTLTLDIILVFQEKLFCIVQLFIVSVQRRVSPFDFPILSFLFFCFILFVQHQILCLFGLNYIQRSSCDVSRNILVKFIFFKINYLEWEVFVRLWNKIVMRCFVCLVFFCFFFCFFC